MINNSSKKRVTLNRRNSSLLLDYQVMVSSASSGAVTTETQTSATTTTTPLVTNEYTRQLVASALSLPSSSVNITTTTTTTSTTAAEVKDNKKIELPLLLKSSLKSTNKSASAPCSPTIGIKSVKFNTHQLEEICLFRKAQTPLAISQKNIFWGQEQDDEEDSSNEESEEDEQEQEETKPIKSLVYANWPTRLSDILDKKNKVIRIEKNTIKLEQDEIIGKILVKNLDYHKTVTIRYTFDFWETIDNISAKYHPTQQQSNSNYDVFTFKLKLPLNATNLYFAVNYKVGRQEFWDNNDGRNYEIQINTVDTSLSKKKSGGSVVSNSTNKTENEDKNNLKSRYDFSTSIHQAKTSTTNNEPTSSSYLKQHKKSNSTSTIISRLPNTTSPAISPSSSFKTNNTFIPASSTTQTTTTIAMPIPIKRTSSSSPTGLSCHSPIASSPIMDLNSSSYLELVNKYCFYSTSPSRSPMSIGG